MKTTVDTLTAIDFISHFFAGSVNDVELRALPSKQRIFSRTPEKIAKFLCVHSNENLYFGVATRQGGGGKEHCRELTALYVDVDGTGDRLDNFILKPSLAVSSGGGWHVYWLLEEPADAHDPRVEPILKGLGAALGADPACTELARILRIPGTYNHKPKYPEPRRINLTRAEWNTRYTLEDFAVFAQMPSNGNNHKEGEFLGVPIPVGVDLHQLLKSKLNVNVRNVGDAVWYDYHGLRGLQGAAQPCLIQSTIHQQERGNPRQCSFVQSDGKFAHHCFDSDCQATGHDPDSESKTRKAVRAIGLESILLGQQSYDVASPTRIVLPDMPSAVLDGRLGEIYQRRLSDFPIAYGWPALLAAASVLIRPQEHTTLPVNLYGCLVGPAHSGKSTAIDRACHFLNVIPPALARLKAGSAEGLLKHIGDQRGEGVLLFPDELAHLLEKLQIQNASFASILQTLFYKSEEELTIAKGEPVRFHCRLSIVGGIIDKKFDDLFSSATTAGLYDRFLFASCPSGFEYLWQPIEGPPTITDTFDEVRIDHDVWAARNELVRNEKLNPRLVEIALRAAAICASFDGRDKLRATNLGPAWELARYQARARNLLQPNEGKNFEAQVAIKILSYLNQYAPDGKWVVLRQAFLAIHAWDYGPSIAERAIRAMTFGGAIKETTQTVGNGQKRRLIRLPKPSDESDS